MSGDGPAAWVWPLALTVTGLGWAVTVLRLRARRRWPAHRALLFGAGWLVAAVALLGPVARADHGDLTTHMAGHVLLGMLAPLLIALSAPVSLVLRALPVGAARRLMRVLASRPARLATHPVTAATLDMGGLWLLYGTGLYGAMHGWPWLGVAIHLHVFVAGYLFAAAVAGVDPVPHRPSFRLRGVVLVGAAASHAVLAKWLVAHPPGDVPAAEAERAAQLMYYGGDAVTLALMAAFWWQWYRATRPRDLAPLPVALSPGPRP